MKPNFNYLLGIKDFFMSNKYILIVWKPFLITIAAVLCVLIAWTIYIIIARIRG